jgi:hypothetical protein
MPETPDGLVLRSIERLDEPRVAIGVDVAVASVYGGGDRLCLPHHGDAVGYGEHDRVAIRDDRDSHILGSVVAMRHLDVVGGAEPERRSPAESHPKIATNECLSKPLRRVATFIEGS